MQEFTPPKIRASRLPHATKAQMLADAKAIASSDDGKSTASTAFYVGIAYGVGFGVEQDMEMSLCWISRSAARGSSAALFVLELLKDPENQQQKILRTWKGSLEAQALSSGQGACRFIHQTSEALELSSFSSADGCNPLHYLSLFEGLTNPESKLGSQGMDVLKRTNFDSQQARQEVHPQELNRNAQSESNWDHSDIEKKPDLGPQEQQLREIVRFLGPNFILRTTAKAHYLHEHFPMILSGTPLSFAITLNCPEAISVLLYEAQRLCGEFMFEGPEIEESVSCHRSEIFSFIWSNCLKNGKTSELFKVFCSKERVHLIAALAKKSSLERTIMHGPNRISAQTNIIKSLITSLYDLIIHTYRREENVSHVAFTRIVSEEVEEIIGLGDLEIATDVRQAMMSCAIASSSDRPYRQGVFKAAVHMACSGYFDLERSKKFVELARNCGQDLNPDFQVLRTMVDYKSEALFKSCIEGDMKVNGCDEDGQSLLHHMINTGFYAYVPFRLVISRGADPNHLDSEGLAPLHLAVRLGLPLVVDDLLANGAGPSSVDNSETSILLHAVTFRNVTIVAKVMEALEAEVEVSELSQASQKRHRVLSQDAYRSILDYGTIDRGHTGRGTTALQMAARSCDTEIVRTLLYHGANADARDPDGNSALHYAFLGNPNKSEVVVSCCNLLLEAVRERLPRNLEGNTPLHLAAQKYQGDALKNVLICFVSHHGCDIDVQNARGETILHKAAGQISVMSITAILSLGASINKRDALGRTAMHVFAHAPFFVLRHRNMRDRKTERMLDTLVDAGANLLIRDASKDSGGYTAMECAVISGNCVLFKQIFFQLTNQDLHSPHSIEAWHHRATSKRWLSSAWSLSVAEEQWHIVKQLLIHPSVLLRRWGFEADLSLLQWPKGVHMLKYAFAVYDEDLLREFSPLPIPEIKFFSAIRVTTEFPGISGMPLDRQWDTPTRLNQSSGIYGVLNRSTQESLVYWESLPSLLKSEQSIGRDGPTARLWSSDQLRYWETRVQKGDIHKGGNPLNEIFEFMTTLDGPIRTLYFGNAHQGRPLANENGFRWEDEVSPRTVFPANWILQAHGDENRGIRKVVLPRNFSNALSVNKTPAQPVPSNQE